MEKQIEKKQVEQMARIICGNKKDCRDCGHNRAERECGGLFFAKRIYEQGYRKQIEGEWVVKWRSTFPQYDPSEYECSICRYKGTVLHKYCPNCGAKMKGGAE